LSTAQFNARGRRPPPSSAAPARPAAPARTPAGPSQATRPNQPSPEPVVAAPAGTTTQDETNVLIERYRKVALDRPGDQVAILRLVELFRQRDGNPNALVAELEAAALAGGERAFAAQLALAVVAQNMGDLARARRALSEVTGTWPKRPEGHVAEAHLSQSVGDLPGARTSLERALPLETGVAKEETLAELWQLCLELSDLECARRHHGALVRLARGNGFVAGELGRALLARGQHREALDELRRVARAAEGDRRVLVPALRDLGRAELVSGQPAAALQTLERASRSSDAEPGLRGEIDLLRADAHRALGTLDAYLAELERGDGTAERTALLARLYEELGQMDRATQAYRRASNLAPADVDLRLSLVRLLELTLDLSGAEQELAKLVRQAPGQVDLTIRYIEILLAAGKRKTALAELDRAIATFERDASASFLLLELAERLQEPERVRRIEVAQAARPGLGRKHLVELGSRAYREGDGEKAHAIWKRLLSDRDKAQGAVLYGETLLAHDDVQGGLDALERAVESAPTELEPRVALARGLLRAAALATGPAKKDYERRALSAWLTVLDDPRSEGTGKAGTRAEARRQVVRLLKRTGRLTAEMAALERAFRGPEKSTEAGLTLAEAQILNKNSSEAERTLIRLHELLPGNREVLVRLERVQLDQGKTEAALGTLERLLAVDPTRARETLGRLSDLAFELRDDERALSYAERASALDPTDAEALIKLGNLYEKSGRPADAEAAYRKALAQDAQLHAVTISLARLLSKRGGDEEALGLLLRGLRSARRADDIDVLGRQALSTAVSSALMQELEHQLRPLCISRPEAPALRTLLLDVLTKERLSLEDQLARGTTQATGAARASLARLADENRGPLLSMLVAADIDQQEQVILLVAWGTTEGASAPLLEFAEGPAPEPLRVAAIEAATRQADERSAARMVAMLSKRGPSPRGPLALALVRGLSLVGGADARRGLELALTAEDPDLRAEALLGLAKRPPPLAEARLFAFLDSSTEGDAVRAAAALGLGQAPRSKAASAALLAHLGDDSPLVTGAVLVALATQEPKDERLLEAATSSLFGPEPRPVAAGLHALSLTLPEAAAPNDVSCSRGPCPKQDDDRSTSVEERLWRAMTETPSLAQRTAILQRYQSQLITALEVALKTSRSSALHALRAMAPSAGAAALAPLYVRDGADGRGLAAHDQLAAAAARSIHLAVLPLVVKHAEGSDRELSSLALGTLCPDQAPLARVTLEAALSGPDDAKFEAAAFALTECSADVALPLLSDFLETRPAWARQRRTAALLEIIGARMARPVDPVLGRLLTLLSTSENELVRSRARAAQVALGLEAAETP